ncbi:GGDEF domain-containing protein [Xanthobacter oligotrophicus]|uniref:diguanylate cyclase n=1 Tax=Xanthobacter oligotrophicus TaxID=2607286 RepID=A0ABW6ZVF2_9HYPH
MLDFTSLLLSIFLSAAGISVVLFGAWVTSRKDGFLLTCAVGAVLVAMSVVFSAFYAKSPQIWVVTSAYALLLGGLSTIYGTAWQFRNDVSPSRAIAVAAGVALGLTLPPHALGYNGVGFFIGFLCAAGLLILAAHHFWMARQEAPGTLITLAAFYFVIGLSFLPRAALVAMEGQAIMPGPPQNWAQNASLALIVAAVPALGALTIALNQKRLVRAHRQQALTDPLTGLPNRRALVEKIDSLNGPVALVLFDIDRFKTINDTRGHAIGDQVIILFARTLLRRARPGQMAARLGGEEFVVVSPTARLEALELEAEQIRRDFAVRARTELDLACTVSGGLARGEAGADNFALILAAADRALYRAKQLGRDRLLVEEPNGTGNEQ